MNRNRNRARFPTGFTLIEILISTAIIFLVAIAVYSVFASGIGIWRRVNQSGSYERDIRLVSEKLSRELRNTFNFSNITFEGIVFEGTEDSIAFAALVKNSSYEESPQYEVGRISYFLNEENVFCRQQETYPQFFQGEKIGEWDELISEVSRLNFSYCYLDNATGEYKWKDRWLKEEQDSIPQAVKLELVFKKRSGQEMEFARTIFIPIGTGEQKKELK